MFKDKKKKNGRKLDKFGGKSERKEKNYAEFVKFALYNHGRGCSTHSLVTQ